MIRVSLLFLLIGTIECRVKFTYSEFLDGSDLRTVSQTDLACSKGCMLYSGTENENLAIFNKANGIEVINLKTLATYKNDNDRSFLYGWTLAAGTYTLMNKDGLSGAQFGLYVVSNETPQNYGQTLRVADAFSTAQFSTTTGWMTIMTRGTGIRMVTLNSADSASMIPKIFAAGYDSLMEDECGPLYNASSVSHAQQSQIDVIGPIATIRFDGLPALTTATVHVGGDVMTEASGKRNSLTISSPGFHGCSHVDTLYYYNLNNLDRNFRSDLDQGVNVHIRSKQWISVESDALIITGLQDQPLKLMGEESYQHDFLVNKVDIRLTWQRTNQNSNFAVQMDATKSAAASSILLALLSSLVFAL